MTTDHLASARRRVEGARRRYEGMDRTYTLGIDPVTARKARLDRNAARLHLDATSAIYAKLLRNEKKKGEGE